MEKISFGFGEEHTHKGPKTSVSEYLKEISHHPLSFAGHAAAGLGGGYAAGAGLGVLATLPIAAGAALISKGKGGTGKEVMRQFGEKMSHGLRSEAVGFGGVGLVAGTGKFLKKYKNEDVDHIKKAAFIDELEKIAKNPVAVNAGKGGKWGAIVGGGVSGITAHQLMRAISKKFPKANKASTAVIASALLAGALIGGEKGGYIGAGMGGAEKITSHL
jgi:hypothetical protein